jgi:hypothetical protein
MKGMHGSKFAGHRCAKKMTEKLKKYAAWSTMAGEQKRS